MGKEKTIRFSDDRHDFPHVTSGNIKYSVRGYSLRGHHANPFVSLGYI